MSEITAEVGGSKSTIYNYFSSKEEIFACAADKFAQEHKENLRNSLKDIDKPIEDTLSDFGNRFIKFILNPEILSAKRMLYAADIPKEVSESFFEEGPLHTINFLAEYFRKEMEKGVLIEADAKRIAWQFVSLLIHSFLEKSLLKLDYKITDDDISLQVSEAILMIMARYKK